MIPSAGYRLLLFRPADCEQLRRLPAGSRRCGFAGAENDPDLDPGRDGADAIISYITQAITVSDQPAR